MKGGVVCYAEGVEASEIAILVLENESDAKEIEESLLAYIDNRAGVFEGYAPQQAALVKNGEVVVNGNYVALLICQDTSTAKKAFLSCFEDTDKDLSVEESISTYVTKTEEVTEPVVMESSQVSTTILNTENNSHMSQTKGICLKDLEQANFEVGYDKETKIPILSNKPKELELVVNDKITSVEAVNINGNNFVPIRSLASATGAFDADFRDGRVVITTAKINGK